MKKMLFYMGNAIICSLFLALRFAFYLFANPLIEIDASMVATMNVLTVILMIIMFVNLYLGFKETKN